MTKRLVKFIYLFCLVALAQQFIQPLNVVAGEPDIRVQIDCEFLYIPENEQQPIIVDDVVLLPVRAILEALRFTVLWDGDTQIVTVLGLHVDASIQIGSNYIRFRIYEGRYTEEHVEIPLQLINGRAMASIDTIRELWIPQITGLSIDWDDESSTVTIMSLNMRMSKIVQMRPIVRPDYWPEHLPYHEPGSIGLLSDDFFEGFLPEYLFPMQFRASFYRISSDFLNLVPHEEQIAMDRYVWGYPGVISGETMVLMRFVQVHNISREDFDAVIEHQIAVREQHIANGINIPNDEFEEIPNADIIFTFDNEIIRYFYRKE